MQVLKSTWITNQLKEASVREANATPPTIGTSVATTNGFGTCLAPAPAQEFHHQPCSSNICTVTTHLQRQRDDDFTTLAYLLTNHAKKPPSLTSATQPSEYEFCTQIQTYLTQESCWEKNREKGLHGLDSVGEGNCHFAQAHVGEQIAQCMHTCQWQNCQ